MTTPGGTVGKEAPPKTLLEEMRMSESEEAVLQKVENDLKRSVPANEFHPAVPGERAPLGDAPLNHAFESFPQHQSRPPRAASRPVSSRWQNAVNKVRNANHAASLAKQVAANRSTKHMRVTSLLTSMDHQTSKRNLFSHSTETASSAASGDPGTSSRFLKHQQERSVDLNDDLHNAHLGRLLFDVHPSELQEGPNAHPFMVDIHVQEEDEMESANESFVHDGEYHGGSPEQLPLMQAASGDAYDGVPNEGQSFANRSRSRGRKLRKVRRAFSKCCAYIWAILCWMVGNLFRSTLLLAIPAVIAAWIFYYKLGNPEYDFMPGNATLSWWFNFFARQCVVFELSRVLQFILVDWFALSTTWGAQTLGPLAIILLVQAKGAPFLALSWGLLATALLHGDSAFQMHWLFWTDIAIYSKANSGSYILVSDEYTRFLFALLVLGAATTIKRTLVALYFGRRNLELYKPKLEKILVDIIAISEVADLAEAASQLPDSTESSKHGTEDAKSLVKEKQKQKKKEAAPAAIQEVRWHTVKFGSTTKKSSEEEEEDLNPDEDDIPSEDPLDGGLTDEEEEATKDPRRMLSRNSSGTLNIKNFLERWNEPLNKADQSIEASIHDIYKFRKALAYMDMVHPFSESFGPATTRDECILSAQNVYGDLLKLSPKESMLPYKDLEILAMEEDGTIDDDRARTLKRLFRPDRRGNVSLIAFVQTCDTVYKRLRFFRASVGNSSVIDGVLESIIDTFFRGVLALVLLSIMKYNPWPLLVSISTLLVTFAFAVGPSAARALEGILLIVLRRPYDIGDRIVLSDMPGKDINENDAARSWFVEDITLTYTVLRYGPSNELATVSNGSIASARVTNCARSTSAIVGIVFKLHLKVHDNGNDRKLLRMIEKYVKDNPRKWEVVLFLRCEEIDPDYEFAMYQVRLRSRHSWQSAVSLLGDRAELRRFLIAAADKLGITYTSPQPRQILYYGGSLQDGAVQNYRSELLSRNNINNDATTSVGFVPRDHQRSMSAPIGTLEAEPDVPPVFEGSLIGGGQDATSDPSKEEGGEKAWLRQARSDNAEFLKNLQESMD